MIENLKTRDITLIPTTFRSTKMIKNVGIFVPKEMLINTCVEIINQSIRHCFNQPIINHLISRSARQSPTRTTRRSVRKVANE